MNVGVLVVICKNKDIFIFKWIWCEMCDSWEPCINWVLRRGCCLNANLLASHQWVCLQDKTNMSQWHVQCVPLHPPYGPQTLNTHVSRINHRHTINKHITPNNTIFNSNISLLRKDVNIQLNIFVGGKSIKLVVQQWIISFKFKIKFVRELPC